MTDKENVLSADQVKAIAKEVAHETVREVFNTFGVNVTDPKQMWEFAGMFRWVQDKQRQERESLMAPTNNRLLIATLIAGILGSIAAYFLGHR